MMQGFIKGVRVNISYLKLNVILEYHPPYMHSNFMSNPGLTTHSSWLLWGGSEDL